MNIEKLISKELDLQEIQVKNVIKLIDEGNTIPFIARYRKEATGDMSDVMLRSFNDRLLYLRNLKSRKEDVKRIIDEAGKLTQEIKLNIDNANTLVEVEDIYAPYKQKKRTKAKIAKEKGLEKLGLDILSGQVSDIDIECKKYINDSVLNEDEALDGAIDIIAEIVSDDSSLRQVIRKQIYKEGIVVVKSNTDEKSVYDMYYDYSENVKSIASHRVLAINRGEMENILKVKIQIDNEKILSFIENKYINSNNKNMDKYIKKSIAYAYKRLIYPAMEREIRNDLTEKSHQRAITVFGENLKNLLLQAPVKGKVVMGFDPAYRTGCKLAIVDENGKLLDFTTIYPTAPQNDVEGSKKTLKELINKYNVDIICIGNGTASRESESFVVSVLKEVENDVKYIIVSEAGASVYSASEIATEEYPDINVSIRGAISIARRLQDPLAELVKIDPKHIGVGQYQHDVNQKNLSDTLKDVVEDAVNSVGVELNSASFSLLQYVSGISRAVAKNIVDYREENGIFKSRQELKLVKRLGSNTFKQCAGFLRVESDEFPLDNTAVHPESYDVCVNIMEKIGCDFDDIINNKTKNSVTDEILNELSEELGVGKFTLKDIIKEIQKPGRDPRDESIKPLLKSDILKIEDLNCGMILKGTVRNVVDFGVFVDIGIKNDALVHKSQMSNKFIKNPMDIVSLGDIVDVKVIAIDIEKKKVSLSMRDI